MLKLIHHLLMTTTCPSALLLRTDPSIDRKSHALLCLELDYQRLKESEAQERRRRRA